MVGSLDIVGRWAHPPTAQVEWGLLERAQMAEQWPIYGYN